MVEKQIKNLQEKVTDYKRFAFILLALTGFLFLGLIIPNEGGVSPFQQPILIGLIVLSISCSIVFHKVAMRFQEELFNEKEE